MCWTFISCKNFDFNPRSPHGERPDCYWALQKRMDFNPRSPHGERRSFGSSIVLILHFNPRSPHGERRDVLATYWESLKISIHAPRTGSDAMTTRLSMRRG